MQEFKEDIAVAEKPDVDETFQLAVDQLLYYNQEEVDFLWKNVFILKNDGFSYDDRLLANAEIRDRIIDDINVGQESRIAMALAHYINFYQEDRKKIFFLISPLSDVFKELSFSSFKLSSLKDVAVPLSQALSQEKIWGDDDRSVRHNIFDILNNFDGIDFADLTDEDQIKINQALDDYINHIKLSRVNIRRFCKEDIISALKIKNAIFLDGTIDVVSRAEHILEETGDTDWPDEAKYFKSVGDSNNDHSLEEDSSFNNYADDDYDDFDDHDYYYNEAVFKPNEFSEELIFEKTNQAIELASYFKDSPDKIKPALQLHYFNNLLAEERGIILSNKDEEIKKLNYYINDEKLAEENLYLPTIGLEIEVPNYFKIDGLLCQATNALGIPETGAGHFNEAWEFASDFSYSAKTQSLLAHELIRGGFIETEEEQERKKILGAGDFSMHLNLGFPLDLAEKIQTDDEFKNNFRYQADILVTALTYAFTSPERLLKRKTSNRFETNKTAKKGKSKIKNNTLIEDDDSEDVSNGRLEIRNLEVRDATLYRLLSEAQLLAASLFSFQADDFEAKRAKLEEIWYKFSDLADAILKKNSVFPDTIDEEKSEAAKAVRETKVSQEFRNLITDTAKEIKKIVFEK